MAEYRYWRITNIKPREDVSWISADYINFINNKNIPLTLANLTISDTVSDGGKSQVSNILTQDNTYWAWNNNIEIKTNISYDFGTPVEVTAIQIRMRQDMQPTWGQEWKEAVIQCSEDKINWVFYGVILPKISQMDLTLKTVPIYTESQIKAGPPVEGSWWSIYPNSCVFAIDHSSTKVSDAILLSSDKKHILIAEKNKTKSFEKKTTVGFVETNFRQDLNYSYKFKVLSILKNNFIFQSAFNIPQEFTFILKCKLNSSSVFLNKSLTLSNHGLAFEILGSNSSIYKYNWRINDTTTGGNYPETTRAEGIKAIETVILKGNITERTGNIITNYGTYPIQLASFTSFFNQVMSVLGYTTSAFDAWAPDADIIAYGLFNKNFSDEELQNILTKIDEQFLIRTFTTKTKNMVVSPTNFYKSITKSIKKLSVSSFVSLYSTKDFRSFGSNLLSEDFLVDSLIIDDTTNIKDYVYEEGQPVKVLLYLYERHSGQLISKLWSNLDGYFEFKDLDKKLEYVVTAHDPKYQFRSIIKNYNKR